MFQIWEPVAAGRVRKVFVTGGIFAEGGILDD